MASQVVKTFKTLLNNRLPFLRNAKLLVGLVPNFIRKQLMIILFLKNTTKIQLAISMK